MKVEQDERQFIVQNYPTYNNPILHSYLPRKCLPHTEIIVTSQNSPKFFKMLLQQRKTLNATVLDLENYCQGSRGKQSQIPKGN